MIDHFTLWIAPAQNNLGFQVANVRLFDLLLAIEKSQVGTVAAWVGELRFFHLLFVCVFSEIAYLFASFRSISPTFDTFCSSWWHSSSILIFVVALLNLAVNDVNLWVADSVIVLVRVNTAAKLLAILELEQLLSQTYRALSNWDARILAIKGLQLLGADIHEINLVTHAWLLTFLKLAVFFPDVCLQSASNVTDPFKLMTYRLQIWAKSNILLYLHLERIDYVFIGWFFLKLHCENALEHVPHCFRDHPENFFSARDFKPFS